MAQPSSSPEILVRPSTDADVSAIHAIYSHYVLNSVASFELDPPSLSDLSSRRLSILALPAPYLVATSVPTGPVLGYAYASSYRPRAGYRLTVESTVYVAPGQQGRGVGTALMRRLTEECREGGYKQIVAVVTASEETRASLRLHEACGFRRVGTFSGVGRKFGRWLDTALFQKEMDTGEAGSPTLRGAAAP